MEGPSRLDLVALLTDLPAQRLARGHVPVMNFMRRGTS